MDESQLRIYLAGNVALERDGTLVPESRFPGTQARLAFALLAMERSNALSMERIADVLWDGESPAAWPTALRAIVSKLRGVLDETGATCSIEHSGGGYQLRASGRHVDRRGGGIRRGARGRGRLARRRSRDDNGLGARRDRDRSEAVPRGNRGRWAARQRAKLHDIQVRALWCRAQSAFARGDRPNAIGDAERVIELEPYPRAGLRDADAGPRRGRQQRGSTGHL